MSGKTARRLRRLTEQAMNAQHGSTTIRPYEDDRAYKKVPVLANRKKDLSYASSNTTEVIKVDQKNPRAFYQQAKKMYKSGEAQREADRIEREYREDQMKAAKQFADTIEAIVEGKGEHAALLEGKGEMPHPEPVNKSPVNVKFTDWIAEKEHPIAQHLPFDIKATPEEMHAGIITAVIESKETGRTATFKVNKDAEFAVEQEGSQGWRMFNLNKFNNNLDEYYQAIADELNLILHLIAEPIVTE